MPDSLSSLRARPRPGDSPAILRLKMLETRLAVAEIASGDERQSAVAMMNALKRAIAEKPSISFADVVAKIKTHDELAQDRIGDSIDDVQKTLLRSALADWARLRAPS